MTEQPNDGGPAFPREDYQAHDAPGQRGMSLRDWFAGQALPSCIVQCTHVGLGPDETFPQMFARRAYEVADAMLAAREDR